MSLTKVVDGMAYEATGKKTSSKGNSKRVAIKCAQELSSGRLAWILISRHKVGLLAIGNAVLVLNWVFPEWTELVKSVI